MQTFPIEIADDRRARIGQHWYGVLILIVGIMLATAVVWWQGVDPLALIAEEGYLNPFSLMLGLAALAMLWRVGRALHITLSVRRDGAASLVVNKGSKLRQGGHLVGEVKLGTGALARMHDDGLRIELVCEDVYALEHTGDATRKRRLIPIESARVVGREVARQGAGSYGFRVTLPSGLKPIATFVERADGLSGRPGFSGATFITLPFMKARLLGGTAGKPAFRRWRVEVIGKGVLAAFDLSEHIDISS